MKNSVEKGAPAAFCVPDGAFDMSSSRKQWPTGVPVQVQEHLPGRNNIIGFPDDLRIKLLTEENQRLKALVEDLIEDKQSQARRIMELNEEKMRLKKAMADMILSGC